MRVRMHGRLSIGDYPVIIARASRSILPRVPIVVTFKNFKKDGERWSIEVERVSFRNLVTRGRHLHSIHPSVERYREAG